MKPLILLFLPLLAVLYFEGCSYKIHKMEAREIRHIERNTIVGKNKKMALPFYENENATIIFLVRHAEKKSEGSNPELSDTGLQRATQLIKLFEHTHLDEVFSTNYLRTVMTAEPLANTKKLGVQTYDPGALSDFAERLRKEYPGKRIFISGHSNTTPALVNLLIGNEVYPSIEESDYDNFFIVGLAPDEVPKVVRMTY